MIYRKAYETGCRLLEENRIADAALDAKLLLEYVCHTTRNDFYAHSERELSADEEGKYLEIIKKRADRIPLQHLTGEQEFMGLTFKVNDKVLIPRQDTETLVEEAMIAVNDGDRVLELCTGSGCIIISLMNYKNDLEAVATDISGDALMVAEENARRLIPDKSGKLRFVKGDLYAGVIGSFEAIISNPPYIKTAEIESLEKEVKEHDPFIALDGGEDGLVFYKRIIRQARMYLKNEGKLFLEIGCDQGEEVSALLLENGFVNVKIIKDLAGNDRVVRGELSDEIAAEPGEMERTDW